MIIWILMCEVKINNTHRHGLNQRVSCLQVTHNFTPIKFIYKYFFKSLRINFNFYSIRIMMFSIILFTCYIIEDKCSLFSMKTRTSFFFFFDNYCSKFLVIRLVISDCVWLCNYEFLKILCFPSQKTLYNI